MSHVLRYWVSRVQDQIDAAAFIGVSGSQLLWSPEFQRHAAFAASKDTLHAWSRKMAKVQHVDQDLQDKWQTIV